MSCYRIKSILNPVKPENRCGFDKTYIKVSCGHCPSCCKQRSNDWLVRTYFEFEYGGYNSIFFVSLDFDDVHLPLYNTELHRFNNLQDRLDYFSDQRKNSHIKPCFDSEVIKGFLKRMRSVYDFRMFYVSEYGGFLHRPHYHVIFALKDVVSEADFFKVVQDKWYYGSHENISTRHYVDRSTTKAIEYVVDYTTKDVSFDVDKYEMCFPQRFSCSIRASKEWGFSALECGDITLDMVINQKPLYLPVGDNGENVPFSIPRYYEMKSLYDYTYDSSTRKSVLKKNQDGIDAMILRHNRCYVFMVKQIFSSRNSFVSEHVKERFKRLYPNSPYNNCSYHDAVFDAMSDFEAFTDFVWNIPFFSRGVPVLDTDHHYKFNIIDGACSNSFYENAVEIPNMQRISEVVVYFEFLMESYNESVDQLKSYMLLESCKKRSYAKLRNRPDKVAYLQKVGFDFRKLDPEEFSSFKEYRSISFRRRRSHKSKYYEKFHIDKVSNYSDFVYSYDVPFKPLNYSPF